MIAIPKLISWLFLGGQTQFGKSNGKCDLILFKKEN